MIKINRKFVFLIIMAFALALIFGGSLFYSVFYVLALAIIIESLYTFQVMKNLSIKLNIKSHVYSVGENDFLQINIRNYSIPYVYLVNEELKALNSTYNGHCMFIHSSESEAVNVELKFKYRGVYDLGTFKVKVSDLFNIFSLQKNIDIPNKKVKIYPRLHEIQGECFLGIGDCQNKSNNKNIKDDLSTIRDVRKYANGDSLKKVHWKLSAKHGQLYVKNFENISGGMSSIFLDMNRESFYMKERDDMEECIEYFVSLINYMKNCGFNTDVFINDEKGRRLEIFNEESFNELMEIMVSEKSDGHIGFGKFINTNLKHLPYGILFYAITTKVDRELTDTLCKLLEMGYKIVLMYNSYDVQQRQYVELLNKLGVKCVHLKSILLEKR